MSRTWLLWALTGATVLLGCAGLIAWDRAMMATADACDGEACVWVYDPFARPGDEVALTVGVYDGRVAGLGDVRVIGPGVDVRGRGRGRTWGSTIVTKSSDRGSDMVDLEVAIPADHPPGEPLQLEIAAEWIAAVSSGAGSFDEVSRHARIDLPLAVHTAGSAAAGRAAALLRAVGALLLGVAVCWAGLRQGRAVDRSGDHDLGEAAGGALVILGMGWIFVGWLVFARPLQAALDLPSTPLSVVAVIGWLGLTSGVAYKLDALGSRVPYRLAAAGPLTAEQVERWLRRLRDEGIEVGTIPGAVWLTRGADRVWFVRLGLRRGAVAMRGRGDDLVLAAAASGARVLGPLVVELHGFVLQVEPTDTPAALRERLDAQLRTAAEDLLRAMERMKALLGALEPKE